MTIRIRTNKGFVSSSQGVNENPMVGKNISSFLLDFVIYSHCRVTQFVDLTGR